MISIKRIEPKDYEKIMDEVYMQIPLYTKEWTNFNTSDPAVTTIEDLMAFLAIQQKQFEKPMPDVRVNILRMLGFERQSGKCARILIEPVGADHDFYLPASQRFTVGDTCFETNRKSAVCANRITAVVSEVAGEVVSLSAVIDETSNFSVKIFGDKPARKDTVNIFMERAPLTNNDLFFYFDIDDRFKRTSGAEGKYNDFAEVEWQIYTDGGFVPLKVKDMTRAFLEKGEVKFKIAEEAAAEYELGEFKGYCIRAVVKRADYDVAPRLRSVHGFLFEVWQKETRSICHSMPKQDAVEIYCDLLEEDFVQVFCKESRGGSYYRYSEASETVTFGRLFEKERLGFGYYRFRFNREKYGFGPGSDSDAIRIVAFSESTMRQYALGPIYGYDNQVIDLPLKNVVPESFSIIARRVLDDGTVVYDFVKPDRRKEGSLYYILEENEGKIIVKDPGAFIGCELFLCSCAVTRGEEGNVRPGNFFKPVGYDTNVKFKNPFSGEGGRFQESLEELQRRFVEDLNAPFALVKAKDYNDLIHQIPDLCIHKVRAIPVPDTNDVKVVVLPYSESKKPVLSKVYVEKITEFLNCHRMLSSGVQVIQPAYIPVDVSGTIYVKPHYENCRERIEEVLNSYLDYINGSQTFGQIMRFDNLFCDIEEIDGVEYIFELAVYPTSMKNAKLQGLDIIPADNALLVPGRYTFEVNTFGGRER